jgi:hypothetical protein
VAGVSNGFSAVKALTTAMCRHRFTARFLSRLVFTGFASPHRVLNRYIFEMTSVHPSDARELVEEEKEVELGPSKVLYSFDFNGIESKTLIGSDSQAAPAHQ